MTFSASAGFTPAHRLLREDGFDHVVHAGSIADRHFKIFFVRNIKSNARLGIIVGKRTLPSAAQRNRVKRAIREVFRRHSIKVQQLDLVVLVRSADSQASPAVDLEALFNQVEKRCAS
ncbi:MAG: ribonuclease P protein component [Gallionella sp.]